MVDTVPSAETCAIAVVSGARVAMVARDKVRNQHFTSFGLWSWEGYFTVLFKSINHGVGARHAVTLRKSVVQLIENSCNMSKIAAESTNNRFVGKECLFVRFVNRLSNINLKKECNSRNTMGK
ncbi:MAG: hypothetical protein ACREPR_01245 [Brasilonema sp.]